MVWTFLIQTNSRVDRVKELIAIISNLTLFNKKIKIIISDNGKQGEDKFRYRNIKFDYISNAEYSDAKSHLIAIFNLKISNLFYIHDDDKLSIKNLLEAMNFIEKNNPNFLISPKLKIDSVISFDNIESIFNMYFLDANNNCPLFSGIYVKNTEVIQNNFMLTDLIEGKYVDVQIVSRLLLFNKSFLFNLPYLKYVEHSSNDNKLRNIHDRISLSKFIKSKKGFQNFIISLLIFHGYKKKIMSFIFGVFLTFLYPPITYKIIKKLFKKIQK